MKHMKDPDCKIRPKLKIVNGVLTDVNMIQCPMCHKSIHMELKTCPCCGVEAKLIQDNNVFNGQIYSDRYPPKVASQNYGFQVRCVKCGLQTCWWHYEKEAIEIWNTRYKGGSQRD